MKDIADTLDAYLVGGAVRDRLLGREIGDRDWVVVGSTVEEMLRLGFQQVGRDFPVFLHPETRDEYALARTERKHGSGHTGFVVHAAADVTLEADLERRDLTINAMAETRDGVLVDPYGGQADLEARQLRHVSAAFAEDPLRVLRVARFAAELPGFEVAPETATLLSRMCDAGALAELSAERVWHELHKALAAPAPQRFFTVLEGCRGLAPWLAELEGQALEFTVGDARDRFVDLPLPLDGLMILGERIKAPKDYLEAARDWRLWGDLVARARTAGAAEVIEALSDMRAHHDNRRLAFVVSHLASSRNSQEDWLLAAAADLKAVAVPGNVAPGPAYGAALSAARAERLERLRADL